MSGPTATLYSLSSEQNNKDIYYVQLNDVKKAKLVHFIDDVSYSESVVRVEEQQIITKDRELEYQAK